MYLMMATKAETYSTRKLVVYLYQKLCQLSNKKHCPTHNTMLKYNIPINKSKLNSQRNYEEIKFGNYLPLSCSETFIILFIQ
jgi:hypothetical protein